MCMCILVQDEIEGGKDQERVRAWQIFSKLTFLSEKFNFLTLQE